MIPVAVGIRRSGIRGEGNASRNGLQREPKAEMRWNREFRNAPNDDPFLVLIKFGKWDSMGAVVGRKNRYGWIETDLDDNPMVRYTPVAWMLIPGWDTEDCFEES